MNYAGADMQVAEWKDRYDALAARCDARGEQIDLKDARIRELETMLRRVQTNSYPAWQYEEILALLGPSTLETACECTPGAAWLCAKGSQEYTCGCKCHHTSYRDGKHE